ncbi:MAG: 2-phosphosulfolactate phosphatase family protein [Hormoscilla sp. GM7CHS1pb]|nr:2-phosphosulfolactate phosphatase family protein [Hormoscilla sp. GM7CHS1pb]
MKLFVYHTPEQTPTDSVPDCAIAVDVLRATTTMATALDAGAEAVQVFSDIDLLMQVSAEWPPEKRLRAGERGGAKVEDCDLGNSPLDCTPAVVQGRRLFISTTNGTRALQRIQKAKVVLTAALINRQALVQYLMTHQPETVWIVGSGWQGSYSLEDTVCAGAIAQNLLAELTWSAPISEVNDEVHAAIALYRQWQEQLLELMQQASHGKRLLGLNCYEDLKYCAQLDILNVLPIQREPGVLVKHQ